MPEILIFIHVNMYFINKIEIELLLTKKPSLTEETRY